MRLKTTIKTLLLLSFLISSCKNGPKFDLEIRRAWSMDFDVCLCQFYDLNEIKKITDMIVCEEFFMEHFPEAPVLDNNSYCQTIMGFTPEALATRIIPKAKEIKRYYEDKRKEKRRFWR